MTDSVPRLVQALVATERQLALLERVRPVDFAAEYERLVASWGRGRETFPSYRYAPPPELAPTHRLLGEVACHCDRLGDEGAWLRGRVEELELEAALIEAIGTRRFGAHAEKRFTEGPEGKSVALEQLLAAWSTVPASTASSVVHLSDERADADSLYSVMRRRLGELGVQASIRVERDLVAVAAVSSTGLVIRAGERLSLQAARRIAEHEIVAHLLPRQSAAKRTDVLRCGCRGSIDDEEGRALVVEERCRLMDPARQRELALRHLAARWSRAGADFVQVVRQLAALGAPLKLRIAIAMRAFRGAASEQHAASREATSHGGLGRELVYLPAYLRLREAFTESPDLEGWFEQGRASLKYARAQRVGSCSSTQIGV